MAASETEPREERRRGGVGRFVLVFLALLVIGALVVVVAVLLSDINRRQYRLVASDGELQVERGRHLPLGFEAFEPESDALRTAYAPVPLPPDSAFAGSEIFQERTDLDRALFGLLAGWARQSLDDVSADAVERARVYVERCELLPGLSEEQRNELRTLKADLAYQNGRRLVAEAREQLGQAQAEFETSLRLGTSRPSDASQWIEEISRRLDAFAQPLPSQDGPTPPDPLTPTPSAPPSQPEPPAEPEAQPKLEPEPTTEDGAPTKWRL